MRESVSVLCVSERERYECQPENGSKVREEAMRTRDDERMP